MAVALVLGASGQIGRFLVPRLLDRGHDLILMSRVPRVSTHARLRWTVGDLNDPAAAETLHVDTVFSLGPLDAFSTWLAHARIGHAGRIVAFGSMSALSKRDSADPRERELAARLLAGEARVIDCAQRMGARWTLLRPTLIYGAGLDRSLSALARFGMRWRIFPQVPGASGLRQPVHAADLADACLAAADAPETHARIYELGGGERLTFATMLDRVRHSLPVSVLPVPIPLFAARTAVKIARLHPRGRAIPTAAVARLRRDLVADDLQARTDLGWTPRAFAPDATTWCATGP